MHMEYAHEIRFDLFLTLPLLWLDEEEVSQLLSRILPSIRSVQYVRYLCEIELNPRIHMRVDLFKCHQLIEFIIRYFLLQLPDRPAVPIG
jgi:hypothetical protein